MEPLARLQQILPREFTRSVEVESYYVGKILKKNAHTANQKLRVII